MNMFGPYRFLCLPTFSTEQISINFERYMVYPSSKKVNMCIDTMIVIVDVCPKFSDISLIHFALIITPCWSSLTIRFETDIFDYKWSSRLLETILYYCIVILLFIYWDPDLNHNFVVNQRYRVLDRFQYFKSINISEVM